MNFTSQICTTTEQSEKLLALGLKAETADCSWISNTSNITYKTHWRSIMGWFEDSDLPAWSLHRLIEMYSEHYVCEHINLKLLTYDTIIENIRLDILTGTFNKEYLKEK